jgi:sulfopyruvate decarboxylase alpha subunit
VTAVSWRNEILQGFRENGIDLICHVADRVLAPIIEQAERDPHFETLTLTREEEGIGILTGAYLGGRRGALMLQSSGFGNILNALGSLAIPYQIPFPILMSQRGSYLEHNVVQVAWGKAVPDTVDALGMQFFELTNPDEVAFIAKNATRHSFVSRRPVVLGITTQLSGGKDGAR